MEGNLLVIFAKAPIPGKVKTRLAKSIGEKEATRVYEKILLSLIESHTHQMYDCIVYIHGDKEYFEARHLIVKEQKGNDLGERMYNAVKDELASYRKVIIIGSDTPGITPEEINNAFYTLQKNDIVIGPAKDGGYYLVGLKQPFEIFKLTKWSTENVLEETKKILKEKGCSFSFLDEKRDIDTVNDLEHYRESGIKI